MRTLLLCVALAVLTGASPKPRPADHSGCKDLFKPGADAAYHKRWKDTLGMFKKHPKCREVAVKAYKCDQQRLAHDKKSCKASASTVAKHIAEAKGFAHCRDEWIKHLKKHCSKEVEQPKCQHPYSGSGYKCCLVRPTESCGGFCLRDKCRAAGKIFSSVAFAKKKGGPIFYTCCKGEAPPPSGMVKVHASTCWKKVYGRGIGKPLHACRPGEERSGLLCYPKCKKGYSGVGPVCWENCKPGYKTAVLLPFLCEKRKHLLDIFSHKYHKKSYGRGLGKPLICGKNEEQNLLLCYPKCRPGFEGPGPFCRSICPVGFVKCGDLMCARNKVECSAKVLKIVGAAVSSVGGFASIELAGVGVGEAFTLAGRLTMAKCSVAKLLIPPVKGEIVVPPPGGAKCGSVFPNGHVLKHCCLVKPTKTCGPACIKDKCKAQKKHFGGPYASKKSGDILFSCCVGSGSLLPPGTTKVYGAACWKVAYGRGLGKPLHTCGPGFERDGLLCYPKCRKGYGGAGPICWQHCKPGYKAAILLPFLCEKRAHLFDIFSHKYTRKSYGRGLGKPLQCAATEQQDLLLCYPKCKKGYSGSGPLCWSNCPMGFVKCGDLMCTRSKAACTAKILKMVGAAVTSVMAFATIKGVGVGIGQAITLAGHLTVAKCPVVTMMQMADLAYMFTSRAY